MCLNVLKNCEVFKVPTNVVCTVKVTYFNGFQTFKYYTFVLFENIDIKGIKELLGILEF